jgi:acetyl esterase/lipase
MTSQRWCAIPAIAVLLLAAADAPAQQSKMHIGYVYPAGGQQGATFEAVVAGQFLGDVDHVYVSGNGVSATVGKMVRPMSGKERNELRIQVDELLARKAVVTGDAKTLQQFKSFKFAKNIKHDPAAEDEELAELKAKYAHATWTADDERRLREIRMKLGMAVRRPANPAISELAVVQVTIAADAQPGPRELRIGTRAVLSNPLMFRVGQLPEFSKPASKTITQQISAVAKTAAAPKGRKTEAEMQITLPAVVNGQILPGQVDRFRLHATKGQRLLIAAAARQLIPYIADAVPGWFQATLTLYDANGKELAYDDDFRFDPDPVLYHEVRADGDYVIEIKDAIYRGREDFVYRITVGELPFVTGIFPLGGPAGQQTTVKLKGWNLPTDTFRVDNRQKAPGVYPLPLGDQYASSRVPFAVSALPECLEKEPNNDPARAQQVSLPVIVNGRIDQPDDCDVFSFEGRGGSRVVAEVYARRLNSPLDSLLKLTDAAGKQLAVNDDFEDKAVGLITHQADSRLSVTLPADGRYYLYLTDQQHKGGPEYTYRLRISPPQPDFDLRIVPSSINAVSGVTVPIIVYALRKDDFTGEIALELKNAHPGLALSGAQIPPNQDQVKMTLRMPLAPVKGTLALHVEGRATIDGREVVHPAVPAEDMIQAFEYRHLVPSEELMVAVTARPLPRAQVRILSATPIRIPVGGTARIRLGGLSGALPKVELSLSDGPPGIAIAKFSPTEKGAEIVLQSDAAQTKEGTKGNLIIVATAKRPAPPAKTKANPRAAPLAILPAIPFEVVLADSPPAADAAKAADVPAKAVEKPKTKVSAPRKTGKAAPPIAPTMADVPYGPHPKQVLHFWKAKADKPTPLLFFIHGGGWQGGDRMSGVVGLLPIMLKAGISVVSVEYRFIQDAHADGVKPPVKAPLHDAARALQFVRSKAAEWNIDKQRIAASGGSAGACSSLWLAFHDDLADPKSSDPVARESTRLCCAAVTGAQTTLDPQQMKEWTPNSNYGSHAFGIVKQGKGRSGTDFAQFLARREEILPWIAEYSPYALVTSDDPPVYLIYTAPPALGQEQKDPTHTANFGVKLQERLRSVGVACELVYPGAPDVKHRQVQDYLIEKLKEPARN